MTVVRAITSRHNEAMKSLRRLCTDTAATRRQGHAWIEGDHLCRALLEHGQRPARAVVTQSGWAQPAIESLARAAPEVVCIPDAAMRELSALESPPALGFILSLEGLAAPRPGQRTVVLDRLQDPGNAGSILRTAAAMGFTQAVALGGTVSLWSPKVLRAGMGAHFGLALSEGATLEEVKALGVPLVGTRLRDAAWLQEATLPDPLAWVFGHEGQGLAGDVGAACTLCVRIEQPGGEESLNVAAAAAVCLYESVRRVLAGVAGTA